MRSNWTTTRAQREEALVAKIVDTAEVMLLEPTEEDLDVVAFMATHDLNPDLYLTMVEYEEGDFELCRRIVYAGSKGW